MERDFLIFLLKPLSCGAVSKERRFRFGELHLGGSYQNGVKIVAHKVCRHLVNTIDRRSVDGACRSGIQRTIDSALEGFADFPVLSSSSSL